MGAERRDCERRESLIFFSRLDVEQKKKKKKRKRATQADGRIALTAHLLPVIMAGRDICPRRIH
jgi:hypothetical protein